MLDVCEGVAEDKIIMSHTSTTGHYGSSYSQYPDYVPNYKALA